MRLLPEKFLKRDYWRMVLKDKISFLQNGRATIRSHHMTYPYWPQFWGLFYEIFIDDNYRIDGLTNVRRIIDAGANIGLSALYFAQTYPEASIDCFEPNPEALAYLRENVAAFENITVHPYALGAHDGESTFYQDAEIVGATSAGTSNILRSKNRLVKEISVESRKLSDFITSPVDILKLDIEGGEMAVIEELAASSALERVRTILMEFHYDPDALPQSLDRMLGLFEQNGFFYYIRRGAALPVPRPLRHSYMLFAFRKQDP